MAAERYKDEEETKPLTRDPSDPSRYSLDSVSSASTTSIVLERLNGATEPNGNGDMKLKNLNRRDAQPDEDDGNTYTPRITLPMEKKTRRILWSLGGLCLGGWLLALVLFVSRQTHANYLSIPYDPGATSSHGSEKAVELDEVLKGQWRARSHDIRWIPGADGEDGLLLEKEGKPGGDYLVVEDVRSRKPGIYNLPSKVLMKSAGFKVDGRQLFANAVIPSSDLKKIIVGTDIQRNWRHSTTGRYWVFDVETQTAEALDPADPDGRIQLATWSPSSDAIVFTRNNNMFIRKVSSTSVIPITTDGGPELFYGVPDWVYEEEVFQANSATWWSQGSDFVAFLRINETRVPEYPIQYFVSRPSGKAPPEGLENYPEVRRIKYPKAGAPNPVVDIQFYSVAAGEVFSVKIDDEYPDLDRLITEVIWAGRDGKVLVKESNRESDILRVILIDVKERRGKTVRTVNVNKVDQGWIEVSETTQYIPSDPRNARPHDGYVDTIIHEGYDHLAYFTPLDNPQPVILTSGKWEVVNAPSAIDLANNLVYFVGTKEAPIQRHVYSVKLDGSSLQPISDVSKEGYFDVSFSTGAGYTLMSYQGPDIPWQRVVSTPSNVDHFEDHIEDNKALSTFASAHDLPIQIYQTITVDGFELQVVERRPPHFDERKRYPVLFYLYGGPGSQSVAKKFTVDFQAYVASKLGYIVVTVDGRGTGFIGRKARCIVRGNLGYYEAKDQIEAAKIWAAKKYIDEQRIAIWGWSYGGFMALKTIEQDGGDTFKYAMAVAPVTDWKYYGE